MNLYEDKYEKKHHKCYVLRELLYIPSYTKKGIYVGLTSKEYEEQHLINAGAQERNEFLWRRRYLED